MSKYTKIIAAFGIAAGLGVASLPVAGTYAINPVSTDEIEFSVEIQPTLTINAGTSSLNKASFGQASITANDDLYSTIKVVTNNDKGYILSIKDADTTLDMKADGVADKIPAVAGALAAGTRGWNYSVIETTGTNAVNAVFNDTDGGNAGSNVAITAADVAVYTSKKATDANGITTKIQYNVATGSDQSAGTYKDKVVYTATANV